MLRTLWNGRTGLYSNQNRLDAISNNIANAETNGYKRVDVAFRDIFYETVNRKGVPLTSADGNETIAGTGSRADKLVRNQSQGILLNTGRSGDIAIEGSGYFRLIDGDGNEYYTRDGSFHIDGSGNFVHSSGLILDIEGFQPQSLKEPFAINEKGEIYSNGVRIGKINLYNFIDKDNMMSSGENLFSGATQIIESNGKVKQGFLESSNVDITKELTDMMITQRAFELSSRTIKSADEMWQIANNLRSK